MRSIDIFSAVSGLVVIGFSLFLIALALLIVIRPSIAERFLRAFASSASTHYTEQGLRLLVGVSIVNFADSMWCPDVFRIFGWAIIVSTAGLLLMPWRWHQKFATRVMPPVFRHLKLFAFGAFALGAFVLYGASHALGQKPNHSLQPTALLGRGWPQTLGEEKIPAEGRRAAELSLTNSAAPRIPASG